MPKKDLRIDIRTASMRRLRRCLTFSELTRRINLNMETFSKSLFGIMVGVFEMT